MISSDNMERNKLVVRLFNSDSSKLVEEELKNINENQRKKNQNNYSLIFLGIITVIVGSFYEVVGKIITVPMGNYSTLLGIPNSIIYLVAYRYKFLSSCINFYSIKSINQYFL